MQQINTDATPRQFNLELCFDASLKHRSQARRDLASDLAGFREFNQATLTFPIAAGNHTVKAFVNEYWTARQRAADNLHEVSYRACFKPQLPRFFIERLTAPGDVVYDPFMGRGTTLLEAAFLGRVPYGNDINPLSQMLIKPRLNPPSVPAIAKRLAGINWMRSEKPLREDLLVFYHPETLREITALRSYFIDRASSG